MTYAEINKLLGIEKTTSTVEDVDTDYPFNQLDTDHVRIDHNLSVSEHQCAFQHDKFVLHFKHLSEERNDKIDTIITGIKVEEQMKKAQEILQTKVIPRNIEFQKRKNNL